MTATNEPNPQLLDALASLNEIGASINRIVPRASVSIPPGMSAPPAGWAIKDTLHLIVESAIKVVPGASAVIYTYDRTEQSFDLASRVSAGASPAPGDTPRLNGIGMRAIGQRRRVLSYQERDLDIHPAQVYAGARSLACFPLVVADQPVGALYVSLHHERHFDTFELLVLENLVNQAAMAIYHARRLAHIQRDLARREEELRRLHHAGLLISARPRLEETLEAILQTALKVTGAQYGIFRLVDKDGSKLVARAVAGKELGQPFLETLPVDSASIMGWVAQHRQPLLIHDLHAAPWVLIYRPLYANLKMRSELAVPLVGASGRLEGVLNLESPEIGAFNDQDSLLLQTLATQAVIAIQQVRLLDALQGVAQRLLTQPCEQVLTHLVELACDLLNAAASAIWTLQGDRLVLQTASIGYERGEQLPLHGSLTGQAILSNSPVKSNDVRADPRFHRPDLAVEQGWSSALIVPIQASDGPTSAQNEPLGAFSVYGTQAEPGDLAGSEWDEKVLTCLAHHAALAVHNDTRQQALRAMQEKHAVAETFAAIGDIAANVLHHLNNQVGTIPVRVQGIEDKCRATLLADAYLAANLGEIERSAREAMASVRKNLDRLRPIHLAPVKVADCVKAAIDGANLSDDTNLQLLDLDDLPVVMAGKHSLTLVFANLVENAATAMKGTGKIIIRGTADDSWVQIDVIDDGPGIDPEWHERIFEFNFTGRRSRNDSAPSRDGQQSHSKLGFGLWWVRTLMMRLGGSIAVESDGHTGTTFHLALPRVEELS
ncbi:MAG: GAF domain-containing protein [Anaerolineae bacterium]|nr:GAF domain-containing protein [Anaerolineae bacterium]